MGKWKRKRLPFPYGLRHITQGFSTRHIAEETAVTHSVVSKIAKKKGITLPRGTGGRPSILSTTDKWYAMRLITSGKVDTAAAVASSLLGTMTGSLTFGLGEHYFSLSKPLNFIREFPRFLGSLIPNLNSDSLSHASFPLKMQLPLSQLHISLRLRSMASWRFI